MNTKIVSVAWLNENLTKPNTIILDASLASKKTNLSPSHQLLQIKGARHFDFKNRFSDSSSSFPNMLPSPEKFQDECQKLGINKQSEIIVYDNSGIYSSPRVWWMFNTMGFKNIRVLDGGFPAWLKNNYPTETKKEKRYDAGDFTSDFQPEFVKNTLQIKQNIETEKWLVVDARSAGRFNKLEPEPRAGLRGGNIPKSVNLPFVNVLENGMFKSKQEIKQELDKLHIGNKALVFSCGSGITACIILLAAELVLKNKKAVYDGSWTEWAQITTENEFL